MPPITHDKSEEHWDIETGYNEKATNDILSFPYRAHSGGSRGALVVLLNLNASDYDHMCRGPIVGFKGKLTSWKWYKSLILSVLTSHYAQTGRSSVCIERMVPCADAPRELCFNYTTSDSNG